MVSLAVLPLIVPVSNVPQGWIDHFSSKYTICGRLVNEDEV